MTNGEARVRFEDFLDTELDGLGRYAMMLTRDKQAAEDLVAEALLRVFVRWDRVRGMEYPVAYARRIITTGFLMEKRSWWRRRTTSDAAQPEQAQTSSIDAADDRMLLEERLFQLPRSQRTAVVLRYLVGLPDAEIAREMGCTAGAVRMSISRGLKTLRISLSDDQL